jgi:hypothetical protein
MACMKKPAQKPRDSLAAPKGTEMSFATSCQARNGSSWHLHSAMPAFVFLYRPVFRGRIVEGGETAVLQFRLFLGDAPVMAAVGVQPGRLGPQVAPLRCCRAGKLPPGKRPTSSLHCIAEEPPHLLPPVWGR